MAGIFDLHVVTVLQNGWSQLSGSLTDFKTLFREPGGEQLVEDEMLEAWHAKLVELGVEVRPSWTFDPPEKPVIGIQLSDTPVDSQALGDFGRAEGGKWYREMIVEQVVTVGIDAPHPQLTRALRVVVRALMMDATPFLLGLGYADVRYLGGGDLSPEEQLLHEGPGMYGQTSRWSAITHIQSTGVDLEAKGLLVAASDITVDGYRGGIEPESGS